MPCCVALGCRNSGNHSFPKDLELRRLWEEATRIENFKATANSRLCSDHFRESDYQGLSSETGLPQVHRFLKKSAVPSIFYWNKAIKTTAKAQQNLSLQPTSKREELEIPLNLKRKLDLLKGVVPNKKSLDDVHGSEFKEVPVKGEKYSQTLDSNQDETLSERPLQSRTLECIKEWEYENDDELESKRGGVFSWQKQTAVVAQGEEDPDPQTTGAGAHRHEGFKCDKCHDDIIGFRYTCVQCADYDLCGACEARRLHPHHYMLRVPAPRPYSEIQSVLQTIRRALLSDSIVHVAGSPAWDGTPLEVKEEVDPISEGDGGIAETHADVEETVEEEDVQAEEKLEELQEDDEDMAERLLADDADDAQLTRDLRPETVQTAAPLKNLPTLRCLTLPKAHIEMISKTTGRKVIFKRISSTYRGRALKVVKVSRAEQTTAGDDTAGEGRAGGLRGKRMPERGGREGAEPHTPSTRTEYT